MTKMKRICKKEKTAITLNILSICDELKYKAEMSIPELSDFFESITIACRYFEFKRNKLKRVQLKNTRVQIRVHNRSQ